MIIPTQWSFGSMLANCIQVQIQPGTLEKVFDN